MWRWTVIAAAWCLCCGLGIILTFQFFWSIAGLPQVFWLNWPGRQCTSHSGEFNWMSVCIETHLWSIVTVTIMNRSIIHKRSISPASFSSPCKHSSDICPDTLDWEFQEFDEMPWYALGLGLAWLSIANWDLGILSVFDMAFKKNTFPSHGKQTSPNEWQGWKSLCGLAGLSTMDS